MAEIDDLRADILAALAEAEPTASSGIDIVGKVCRACARLLPVGGAAVSVIARAGQREVVYASDAISAALAELQFSLGEGPCFEADETGGPILVPFLAGSPRPRWPVFAAQATEHEVAALFTFPVRIGAVRVATLDTYRTSPGQLSAGELAIALQVADVAALALSGLLTGERSWLDGAGWTLGGSAMRYREVHQATGMLVVQLDLPAAAALARMRAYAFSHGRPLLEVAADIVARRLRLDDDHDRS
ncbi:GAF domain-containing protein [Amycolatopsis minnesotensis]|uniref:GAF domain-containing protein n=1 Tax=Amycolatopsis minnesotensis TaxID=337894 RepID=UPI0031DB976A